MRVNMSRIFFFQAEDGIRDLTVTGVQTCALPISVWTVEEAEKKDLPIEIIKRSLEIRRESANDQKIQKSFAAKMVQALRDRKSTRLDSSHSQISYAVFCLKKKKSYQ